jgi:hypothetical protein
MPTLVTISVSNVGTEPLQLTGSLRAHAFGADGKDSVVKHLGESFLPDRYAYANSQDPTLHVAVGGTAVFYMRTPLVGHELGQGWKPAFLYGGDFDNPGAYPMRVELLTRDPIVSFTSNQAILTVDQPKGIDAIVRALVTAPGSGTFDPKRSDRITRQILALYPDSRYAPYRIPFYETSDRAFGEAIHLFAIRLSPPESYATELRLGLMHGYVTGLGAAISNFNLQDALALREKASAMAQRLLKSRFAFAAEEAMAVLDELPTREEVSMQIDSRVQSFSSSAAAVTPFVQCVDRGVGKDDPLITYFGYDSPNRLGKYIPVGSSNRVRPEEAAVDLPVYFAPGHNPSPGNRRPILAVTDPGEDAVSWTLDGGVASVTSKTPACPPPSAAAPVVPLFDCVTGDGDDLTATFGYDNPNLIAIRIPYGPANNVSGEGKAPTVFLPGEHHAAVKIKAGKEGGTAAWTLQGTTASATAKGLPCSFQNGEDAGQEQ